MGVTAAARQLSLHESQIYAWRKTVKKDTTTTQREQELAAEVAKGRTSRRARHRKKGRHQLCFSVVRMVKVFKVSLSGFYYWIKHRHKAIQRKATRQEFDAKVKDAFNNSKGRDGSRRIQKELAENGDSHNVKTIAASMKRQDLTPKAAPSIDKT